MLFLFVVCYCSVFLVGLAMLVLFWFLDDEKGFWTGRFLLVAVLALAVWPVLVLLVFWIELQDLLEDEGYQSVALGNYMLLIDDRVERPCLRSALTVLALVTWPIWASLQILAAMVIFLGAVFFDIARGAYKVLIRKLRSRS